MLTVTTRSFKTRIAALQVNSRLPRRRPTRVRNPRPLPMPMPGDLLVRLTSSRGSSPRKPTAACVPRMAAMPPNVTSSPSRRKWRTSRGRSPPPSVTSAMPRTGLRSSSSQSPTRRGPGTSSATTSEICARSFSRGNRAPLVSSPDCSSSMRMTREPPMLRSPP